MGVCYSDMFETVKDNDELWLLRGHDLCTHSAPRPKIGERGSCKFLYIKVDLIGHV